jgi:hypothetical protein
MGSTLLSTITTTCFRVAGSSLKNRLPGATQENNIFEPVASQASCRTLFRQWGALSRSDWLPPVPAVVPVCGALSMDMHDVCEEGPVTALTAVEVATGCALASVSSGGGGHDGRFDCRLVQQHCEAEDCTLGRVLFDLALGRCRRRYNQVPQEHQRNCS